MTPADARVVLCLPCRSGDHARCRETVLLPNYRTDPADLGLLPAPCVCGCRAIQLPLPLPDALPI